MIIWEVLLWISLALVFYNYAGYAIIVYILNKVGFASKSQPSQATYTPGVSFIVAAYNEESCIREKILDSLKQLYPADKLELIFITDGSNDQTPEIVKEYPAVRLLHRAERAGKSAALNRAVAEAKNEILIFCDANTVLNPEAIALIAAHYSDPGTGGVAGEKKVMPANGPDDRVGESEGLYWKYESALKKLDSRFYSVVGAAGELFSLRKSLWESVDKSVILDDFIISLKVAQKGYRFVYEPRAYAMELPSFSIEDEGKRKVRIAAGGFQAMGMLGGLFKFWKHPRLSFLYISHRVMRWAVSPFSLVIALISSLVLAIGTELLIYKILSISQVAFYLAAIAASANIAGGTKNKVFKLPFYLTFMNISVIRGFFRHLAKNQPATWEKARRAG